MNEYSQPQAELFRNVVRAVDSVSTALQLSDRVLADPSPELIMKAFGELGLDPAKLGLLESDGRLNCARWANVQVSALRFALVDLLDRLSDN